jgi:hypothetical protein
MPISPDPPSAQNSSSLPGVKGSVAVDLRVMMVFL